MASTTQTLEQLAVVACRRFGVRDNLAGEVARTIVQLLITEYGGTKLYIPIHEHARRIRDALIVASIEDQRRSIPYVARRNRISEERVRQILRRVRDERARIAEKNPPAPSLAAT